MEPCYDHVMPALYNVDCVYILKKKKKTSEERSWDERKDVPQGIKLNHRTKPNCTQQTGHSI